jgi:S-DNA-T family DNA segregation ATPase FtsK/SpoIIIE
MNKQMNTHALQSDSVLIDSLGWVLIISSVMAFLMFASYTPTDPSFFQQTSAGHIQNLLGKTGANISAFFMHIFGYTSFFLPVFLLFSGVQVVRRRVSANWLFGIIGGIAMLLCLMSVGGSFGKISYDGYPVNIGGLAGAVFWDQLHAILNTVGSYLFILLIFGLAILISTTLRIRHVAHLISRISSWIYLAVSKLFSRSLEEMSERRKRREHHRILKEEVRRHSLDLEDEESRETEGLVSFLKSLWNRIFGKRGSRQAGEEDEVPDLNVTLTRDEASPLCETVKKAKPGIRKKTKPKKKKETPSRLSHGPDDQVHIVVGEALIVESEEVQTEMPFEIEMPKWRFPNVDIFESSQQAHRIDQQELAERRHALKEKLGEFYVTGTMTDIIPGPVVTTYELKPDPGIKYSKIVGLQDDICLALGAESMRIDRIPGRYSIGFEIPNLTRETIYFKEMITHEKFVNAPGKLTLTLGKTIEGEPYCSDLAKMPHLLIAGQTGSGKSVGLNAMICSILMRATPEEVKFILIDPKMVEMVAYNDIPHLITPVVNDCIEASNALKWAVTEMEDRYKLMARYMCRGIDQFNKEFMLGNLEEEDGDELALIPLIVIVIDELADLMMVARGEVEESIARLAQKSRAVGIHLILATQRPSTDILTGLIKSNLPCRLSYRVAQRNDSRIILDTNGADQLLGRGDALFMPPGSSRLIRIHAPWLSPREITTLTASLKKQAKPDYQPNILEDTDASSGGSKSGKGTGQEDPMYEKAARLVVSSGQASVSYLQRKLSVGYARAAKLVDMMEDDGIVGPHRGSKARDVLVPPDYFSTIDEHLK